MHPEHPETRERTQHVRKLSLNQMSAAVHIMTDGTSVTYRVDVGGVCASPIAMERQVGEVTERAGESADQRDLALVLLLLDVQPLDAGRSTLFKIAEQVRRREYRGNPVEMWECLSLRPIPVHVLSGPAT